MEIQCKRLAHRFLTFLLGVSYSPTETAAWLHLSLLCGQQVTVAEGVCVSLSQTSFSVKSTGVLFVHALRLFRSLRGHWVNTFFLGLSQHIYVYGGSCSSKLIA